MSVEAVEPLVSIVTGVVGLLVGVYGLWAVRDRSLLPSSPDRAPRLERFEDERALQRRRVSRWARPLVGSVMALACFAAAAEFWRGRPDDGGGILLLVAILASLYVLLGRSESTTLKKATVQVNGEVSDVMDRAHRVLLGLGLRLVRFDRGCGIIEARRGMNLRTFGEVVHVTVREAAGATEVVIVSDAWWPTTLGDWGANQRNVDRFMAGLLAL